MKDKDSLKADADNEEEDFVNAPEASSEPSPVVPSAQDVATGPSFVRGPDGRMVDSRKSV